MIASIINILKQFEKEFSIDDLKVPFNLQCLNKHSNNGTIQFSHIKLEPNCIFIGAKDTIKNEYIYFDSRRGNIPQDMCNTIFIELQSQLDNLRNTYNEISNCNDNVEELLLNKVVIPYMLKKGYFNSKSAPKVAVGRQNFETRDSYKVIKFEDGFIEIQEDRIHYFSLVHGYYIFSEPQHIIKYIWDAIDFICR